MGSVILLISPLGSTGQRGPPNGEGTQKGKDACLVAGRGQEVFCNMFALKEKSSGLSMQLTRMPVYMERSSGSSKHIMKIKQLYLFAIRKYR